AAGSRRERVGEAVGGPRGQNAACSCHVSQPGGGRSDLEDLSLLLLSGVVNLADELIGDLLDCADGGLDLVLADVAVLLHLAQVVDLVATDVANRDTCLLGA